MQGTRADLQEKTVIFRSYQVIWYLLGVAEVLLGFRFILKAGGANPGSPFVAFVYTLSGALVAPFRGVFSSTAVEGSVIEWASLLAMLVYVVAAYALIHLFQLIKPVNPKEVEEVVDNV